MRNIALRLRYDGSAYHGWQAQKTQITVQETLEKALTQVCGHPVKAVGCGRTDAGVHALRYCANFRTDCGIPIDRGSSGGQCPPAGRYRGNRRLSGGRRLQRHWLLAFKKNTSIAS